MGSPKTKSSPSKRYRSQRDKSLSKEFDHRRVRRSPSYTKSKNRHQSSSPEILRKKSLSPGTKEILAYKAEQELAKMKKSKGSLYSDEEIEEVFPLKRDNASGGNKSSRIRQGSGDSYDDVERLRLQALNTLKKKASKFDDDDEDEEYVEKKVKKSKKKRDRSSEARELLESLLPKKKKKSKKSSKYSDS